MPNGTNHLDELKTLFQSVLSATTDEIAKKQEIEQTLDTILQGIAALAERPYDERREVQNALAEIRGDVKSLRQQVGWGNKILSALYSQIETLVSLVASGSEMNRDELRQMQRQMREQIFDTQSGLRVQAAGDVSITGDVVGKDKKEIRERKLHLSTKEGDEYGN
jgi:hypothetical protein